MKHTMIGAVVFLLMIVLGVSSQCRQGINCHLPDCFCSTSRISMDRNQIPQIIYFGFDDALNVEMARHYRHLFSSDRRNPNGCPISMSLYVQHQYTDYGLVNEFYHKGMEIGVHSVTHTNIITSEKLLHEAEQQRKNLAYFGRIPIEDIVGWRSPNLKTAGDAQPDVLKHLGYEYDISLTYVRSKLGMNRPWPYTLDYGYPFTCQIRPCPSSPHRGFWEVPVNSLVDYKNAYPCPYVDGCYNRADNEEQAFKYLWQNFLDYYEGSRSPLGFNMHAAWFFTDHNLKAMDRFITQVLQLNDVYIVNVKQLLDWMKEPTTLSNILYLPSWNCGVRPVQQQRTNSTVTTKRTTTTTTTTSTTTRPTTTSTTSTTTTPITSTTTTSPTSTRTTTTTTQTSTTTTKTPPTTTKTPTTTTKTPTTTTQTPTTTTKTPTTTTQELTTTPTPTTALMPEIPTQRLTTKSIQKHLPKKVDGNKAPISHFTPSNVPSTQSTAKNDAALPQSSSRPPSPTRPSTTPLLRASQLLSSHSCVQGANCKLPNCKCRSINIPNLLHRDQTPQMVYFTFDGSVNFNSYVNIKELFSSNKKNPNNCSVSATMFVSKSGNFMQYLTHLANMGIEIGLRGDDMDAYRRSAHLNSDLENEITYLKSKLPVKNLKGWRSPALKSLGDDQYKIIKKHNLMYDSTLSLPIPASRRVIPWPYTLDFMWQDRCEVGDCPEEAYPGLWEVPVVPITDYKNEYPCTYADGCMFNPPTAEDTFNFLWNNFKEHYLGNRSPFGITLRQQWFSHPVYRPNVEGLERFIDTILTVPGVYVVSIEKIIQWMQNPTPLSQMGNFEPWKC